MKCPSVQSSDARIQTSQTYMAKISVDAMANPQEVHCFRLEPKWLRHLAFQFTSVKIKSLLNDLNFQAKLVAEREDNEHVVSERRCC